MHDDGSQVGPRTGGPGRSPLPRTPGISWSLLPWKHAEEKKRLCLSSSGQLGPQRVSTGVTSSASELGYFPSYALA